jgi:Leucine-rich repeat (LRR) protein
MEILLKIVAIYFFTIDLSFECNFGNETCKCSNVNKYLVMECLLEISVVKMDLDFSLLNVSNVNKAINLTIQNKIFDTIGSSVLSPNLIKYLVSLNLENNQIKSFDASVFSKMTNLVELQLNENNIRDLNNKTFEQNMTRLETLGLGGNEISFIQRFSFRSLNSIKILLLHGNKIEKINRNLFENLKKLEILRLQSNSIDFIEKNSFEDLISLRELHLFKNRLNKIECGIFEKLLNLKELRLDFNEILTIEKDSLANPFLTDLKLNNNRLKFLLNVTNMTGLREIFLNENEFTILETKSFNGLNSLAFLYVFKNKINFIESSFFEQFNSLKGLSITYNQLKSFEINSLSMETLLITNNLIDELNLKSFINCAKLKWIDISNNRIVKIQTNSFQTLQSLVYLNLSFNYLDGFNNGTFMGLEKLEILDLSFNRIKVLSASFFGNFLKSNSYLYLNLSSNQIKKIEISGLDPLRYLLDLNLEYNCLRNLSDSRLFSKIADLLTNVSFKSNAISLMESIKPNLMFLKELTFLDLSFNFIESLGEKDFVNNLYLKSIDLSYNLIRSIHPLTFSRIYSNFQIFKCSNNRLDMFNMSLIYTTKLYSLDLSFNNLSIIDKDFLKLKNIKSLTLKNVTLMSQSKNISISDFFNKELTFLDLSQNNVSSYLKGLNILVTIETLVLKQVNLETMLQIDFEKFSKLKYLDLSFNFLIRLDLVSFESLNNLEYLDVSFNQIEYIDDKIFKIIDQIQFLNLENNKLKVIAESFVNFLSLTSLKFSNNFLEVIPNFLKNRLGFFYNRFKELYVRENQMKTIRRFSSIASFIKTLDLSKNNVDEIEIDAFFYLKSLRNLSLSHNKLTKLTRNNFDTLFNLNYLNLSFNLISSIENGTFINLNKLITLDFNYNSLKSIESNSFQGLIDLRDLFILDNHSFTLNSQSLNGLLNLNNLYIDEMLVSEFKCIFMHSLERTIQRNVDNKYVYYRSINLLTQYTNSIQEKDTCDLKLTLLQFKIHLNLKNDYENELFYEKCEDFLVKLENNFNHTKKQCFREFEFDNKEFQKTLSSYLILKMLSNGYFLITAFLLASILGPVFVLVCMELKRRK